MTLNARLGMRDSLTASPDIKFECSQCGQRIVVERSGVGFTVDCPGCRRPVQVPHHDTFSESGGTEMRPAAAVEPAVAHPEPTGTNSAPVDDLEQARAEIARQNALFKRAVEECERLKANATHVQAELKSFQADRQQLKADLAQTRHAAQTAEADSSELTVALAAVQQENAELRSQMAAEIHGLQDRLAAYEQALNERDTQLGQAIRTVTKARSDLSASVVEVGGVRSELQAHQQGLQSTGQQLHAAKAELQETLSHYQALSEEHQTTTQQRDEWKERAEGLERDLLAIDTGRDLLELRERFKKLEQDHAALGTKLADHTEQAEKNSNALKGIVERQNATLGDYHSELRRLRRARLGVRMMYALFLLGLLALGWFAYKTIAPSQINGLLQSVQQFKNGL
jgi:chromosome segregation ATPase